MSNDKSFLTRSRGRVIASIAVILALLTTAVMSFGVLLQNRPQVEEREVVEPSYNVDVFTVQPIDFREMITAFGTAQADREVVVAAQVTGEVIELSPQIRVGRSVSGAQSVRSEEGGSQQMDAELLVRIDPRDYQQRVDQATATIASAETEIGQLRQQERNLQRQLEVGREDLKSLKDEYQRNRELRERGAGSASELTRALLEMRRYEDTIIQFENQLSLIPHQITTAEQRKAGAMADLKRAENDVERTSVRAPFGGVIADVMVEQGQFVRAGDQLLRLVDPERIEVPVAMGMEDYLLLMDDVTAGEFPVARLAENESANARWTGRVVRVAPDADASSRTIEVFIEVMNSEQDQPLLPGTFVFARIEGPRFRNAVVIPRSALIDDHVFVVNSENRAELREVEAGRRLRSLVLIKSGLNAGDQVVLTNLDIVRDGTQVIPQGKTAFHEEMARQRVSVVEPLGAAPPSE